MLRICLVLLLTACAGKASSSTTPSNRTPNSIVWPEALDHPSTPTTHREAALRMLDASGASSALTTMMEISLQQQLNVNPSLRQYEQVLRDFLGKYLSYESLREDMAKLYMDRFSELQLVQMLAFYRTTTGQLAVSELPKLSQAGAELGARRIEEHKAELMQALFETHQPKP